MKKLIIFVLALFHASVTQADWASFGAAAKCSPRDNRFELAPVIEVSDGNPGAINVQKGFRRLKDGTSHLECDIGGLNVRANVHVQSYGDHMCQGGGMISFSLRINRNSIYKSQDFNWFCDPQTPRPFQITITSNKNKIVITECKATDWYYDEGYKNKQCTERELQFDRAMPRH
jgi:hypothetical protein